MPFQKRKRKVNGMLCVRNHNQRELELPRIRIYLSQAGKTTHTKSPDALANQ